jgi:hypothetical protein
VELTADEQEITTFDNNVTDVSLSCEMSLYLRPDENLQWFRGGQQIINTDRHTITYTNGTGMGQFGEDTVGSSRISTLVISEPRLSDSGTYTCAIINTEHSQDIELTVESAGRLNIYLYSVEFRFTLYRALTALSMPTLSLQEPLLLCGNESLLSSVFI